MVIKFIRKEQISMLKKLPHFKFWCQHVLPLVYDESLSYYETLCKVVKYINEIIKNENEIIENVEELKAELDVVQQWIDNFDDNVEAIIVEYIEKYVHGVITFGLTNDGYFCAYIPDNMSFLHFDTVSDYDDPLYGHLILSYD
jgi:hypothetical protein